MRTKTLPAKIQSALEEIGVDSDTIQGIVSRVPEIGRESKKKEAAEEPEEPENEVEVEELGQTKQLIFLGQNEIEPLARKFLAAYQSLGPDKWKKAKIPDITKMLGASLPKSVDIAMFGRMTTSDAFEDVQAAVQVAHALSTNALTEEFDYYTAVDDLSGETGAGMIGDVEFNSSTYYKYLNVHWEKLLENLGGDHEAACQAVLALMEAAATAHPSGKQNSFAAFNLPDLVLVEITGRNLPVSYANAFIKPVKANGHTSLVEASVEQMGEHMGRLITTYGLEGQRAYIHTVDTSLPGAQALASLQELQNWVSSLLP